MIGGLGPVELGCILIVALLIFGPSRLPKAGKSLGKTISSFRRELAEGLRGTPEEQAQERADAEREQLERDIRGEGADSDADLDDEGGRAGGVRP